MFDGQAFPIYAPNITILILCNKALSTIALYQLDRFLADMKRRKFTIVLKPGNESRYTAQCLEIPQARSEGSTKKEALRNAKEAIELVLEYVESKTKRTKKSEVVEISI